MYGASQPIKKKKRRGGRITIDGTYTISARRLGIRDSKKGTMKLTSEELSRARKESGIKNIVIEREKKRRKIRGDS